MSPRTNVLALVASTTALGLALAGPAGAAASSSVDVIDRETVRASLTSAGSVKDAVLLEQLTLLGNGKVALLDPTSDSGVRNLQGFSAPKITDGKAVYDLTVDGRKDVRTLSDFTGHLPVSVEVLYRLDGRLINAEDLGGKTGDVLVQYTVTNLTSAPTKVTYNDASGKAVSTTVDAVTPYVGRIDTTLPSSFTDVSAPAASVGGDGRGGTGLSFNMVLFPPIGANELVMTWKAHVEDAVVPPADVTVVPAAATRTEVANAAASYSAGAKGAGDLTQGAGLIDANLLKLQAGAGDLLEGLGKLSAGATALKTGLAGKAAPGAAKLAAGLGSAKTGSSALTAGLGQIAEGNSSLSEGLRSSTGAADLTGGADQVAAGLVKVTAGIKSLVAVDGLPAAAAGLQTLLYGLDHPVGAAGATDTGGLLQGLRQIAGGLSNPAYNPADPTNAANPCGVQQGLASLLSPTALPAALTGVTDTEADLTAKLATGGPLAQLQLGAGALAANVPGALDLLAATCGTVALIPDPTTQATLSAKCTALIAATPQLKAAAAGVAAGVASVVTSTQESLAKTTALKGGLTQAIAGLTSLQAGVSQRLAPGAAKAADSVATLVVPGVEKLLAGITGAVTGIGTQLVPGADALSAGSATLADKLGDAADGAAQLAAGSSAAAAGASKLDDGVGQLAAGATTLSGGLDDAADGAGQIADGLAQATPGAAKIEAGAGQLSKEGTSVLAAKGSETQAENAQKAATLVAMGAKVADGALPYGAPEGATGTAVYKLQLAAATKADSDNGKRGVAAAVLLGLACLGGTLVRRRAR